MCLDLPGPACVWLAVLRADTEGPITGKETETSGSWNTGIPALASPAGS